MEEIKILYEDSICAALYKPAGLVVHPSKPGESGTLVDWILHTYPHAKGVGEPLLLSDGTIIDRSGIVHRLDKETSGVILIAKTEEGYRHLKKQFKHRSISKEYNAFVYGCIKTDRGTIDRPIGRSKNDFRKKTAQRGMRGDAREAVTVYRVIERSKDVSLIEARPLTGRTHQIRVHMKAINHPIVGDSLYAPQKPSILGFTRLALHAKSIEFTDDTGKLRRIEAPFPKDFALAIEALKVL